MNEDIKKFELNTSVLKNFENIMSIKLDEIEELKVTGLDQGSKILNIISLCANIKTLILEGDQRLNTDKILANVFKPENVENLVLNNVKIPGSKFLSRYTNLKMISLNDIRFCNIEDFFSSIVSPEKLDIINISNTDMSNHSAIILERFSNIKYLNLSNLNNFKLDKVGFLKKNSKLLKIDITKSKILLTEIENLVKCKCLKNINLNVLDEKGKEIERCKFEMAGQNDSTITLDVKDFEYIYKKSNLYKIQRINVIINEKEDKNNYIKQLKKLKKETTITIKDFSSLNIEQAKKLKETIMLESIKIESDSQEYSIDTYIQVRSEIDKIIENISKHVGEIEKFLEIYKFLGNEFELVNDKNINLKNKTSNPKQMAKLLQECLYCMNIKSHIIIGKELETNRAHLWTQVLLEGKWYNADLALDMENIKHKKVEYCLLGDKTFLETHLPKKGTINYCAEDFNPKLVNVFFKTGLFKENLVKSYAEIVMGKIKIPFNSRNKEDFM